MTYRLAVDLGTAYAAAAVANGMPPTVVGLGNRAMQVPSVLYLDPDGGFLVGELAERRGITDPNRLAREFKRRLGDSVPIVVGGAAYSPETLMARLLRWIVDTTAGRQGELPAEVVLTHPANWGPYKLELFEQVVALADVPPVIRCTEPEAAAAQYAARERLAPGERIGVYDLGGGTFDICILGRTDTGFEILGKPDGIEHLGGADFDEALTRVVQQSIGSRLDALDPDDPAITVGLARLRRDCVDAKETLSSEVEARIPVALPGLNTTVRVTRSELEWAIRPALEDTIAATRRALRSAGLAPSDLGAVVLVGGSSRIPLVAELVQRAFGVPVALDTHPKHDVVLGAARFGTPAPTRSAPAESSTPAPSASTPTTAAAVPPAPAPPARAAGVYEDADYVNALGALFAERWDQAVSLLERVQTRFPESGRVAERLEHARTRQAVAAVSRRAAAAEAEERWPQAVEALEEWWRLGADDPAAVEARLEAARGRQRRAELVDEIRGLHRGGHWSAVVRTSAELEALDTAAVPAELLAQAREALVEAELGPRYVAGVQQLDEGDWSGAVRTFEGIVAERPGFRDASALLARARQRTELPGWYETAVRAEADGASLRAAAMYRRILQVDRDFRDAAARLAAVTAAAPPAEVAGLPEVMTAASPNPAPIPGSAPLTRRRLAVAGAAAAAVVVVIAIVVANQPHSRNGSSGSAGPSHSFGTRSGSPATSTSMTTTTTSSPGPTASPSTPVVHLKNLDGHIPRASICKRVPTSADDAMFNPGAQIEKLDCYDDRAVLRVFYRLYKDPQAMAGVVRNWNESQNYQSIGDCSSGTVSGQTTYSTKRDGRVVRAGTLYCYPPSVFRSLTWTEDRLIVFAIAYGSADSMSFVQIKDWWTRYGGPTR